MSDVKVVKVLVDPKRVSAIITDTVFIQMIVATRNKDGRMVKWLCNTLEHNGYTMEEITAAVEHVS